MGHSGRMPHRPRVLAIVQAGGAGSRMDVLTRERAKPALPFAGHYQLIDFALSSLANSGISDIWVGVQYQAMSLARHVAGGRPWDLDRTRGGLRWLVPEEGAGSSTQTGFSAGNADDLYRRLDDIRAHDPDVVLVLSSDSVFALDLRDVVEAHVASGADCTVVTKEVTRTQAKAKGVVTVGAKQRVTAVDYKPSDPPALTIAAEIFAYSTTALIDALETLVTRHTDKDGSDTGLGDFGETLLPHLVEHGDVRAYPLEGYWRDMGTPGEYLAGHRDVLAGRVDLLGRDDWPVLTRFPELAPARIAEGAVVADSIVTAGCDVRGTVRRSVLGPGVRVAAGAVVEDSIIFARSVIEPGAHVATSILDAHVHVGRDARVGELATATRAHDGDLVIVGRDSTVGAGVVIERGGRLEPGTTA